MSRSDGIRCIVQASLCLPTLLYLFDDSLFYYFYLTGSFGGVHS